MKEKTVKRSVLIALAATAVLLAVLVICGRKIGEVRYRFGIKRINNAVFVREDGRNVPFEFDFRLNGTTLEKSLSTGKETLYTYRYIFTRKLSENEAKAAGYDREDYYAIETEESDFSYGFLALCRKGSEIVKASVTGSEAELKERSAR